MTLVAVVRKRMRVKTCQTLRTISEAGGGGEQKINPVHYLQPTSYPVTSLRENIINLPANNSRTPLSQGRQLSQTNKKHPPSQNMEI